MPGKNWMIDRNRSGSILGGSIGFCTLNWIDSKPHASLKLDKNITQGDSLFRNLRRLQWNHQGMLTLPILQA